MHDTLSSAKHCVTDRVPHHRVIIIGASGHARVIADMIQCSGDEVMGFLDDRNPSEFPNMKIWGKVMDAKEYFGDEVEFVIGIGQNKIRKDIALKLQ
ncbi:MAG: hypothetical protein RR482_08690, partial [Clostridia bacterium]